MVTRKLLTRALLTLSITAALGGAPGCASTDDEAAGASESELSEVGGPFGPALFRNDFYTYLKREGGYGDDEIKKLVLMPTAAAIVPAVRPRADAPLAAYDEAFSRMRPTDFYRRGLEAPLVEERGPNGALESELRRHPVHIVVVPGIFGEFIPVSPFEEVFRAGGSARAAWDRNLAAAEADPSKADLVHDRQFSTAVTKDVERSLRDLVRVGSIDDADGAPLVTVTYLKPELGSLETFGTLDENADYYLTRLEKYFRVAGAPPNVYVMGYSRGAATALNLVTRARDARASWLPNLRGVISLAGVVYGSQLADAALSPGPQKDLLDTMNEFVTNKLESCDGPTPSLGLMTRNLGHWTAFSARAATRALKLGNRNEELAREGIETDMADLGRIVTFARRVLFGDPRNVFSTTADDGAILGVLRLNRPTTEYCQNIASFKATATQLMKGVATLTTQARLDWYRTHTLPASLRYFAITGTMGDATPEGGEVSPLTLNDTAYDTRSVDFRSLRGNYYDLLEASGSQVQDSQVPVQRARFFPELQATLNPAQSPMKTYFMGTLGIHHWGLSFPRAFSTRDGLEANPYPRTLLLKSIATFVAQVERRGG